LLLAISDGDGDVAVEIVLKISETAPDFDEAQFRQRAGQLVSEQTDRTLKQHDVGRALLEVRRAAADTGLYSPSELTILGKTLLQLDEVGRILSPNFNPNASVRRNVGEILRKRVLKTGSPARLFGGLLELKDFIGGLPGRVSRLLDAAANAELEVRVKTPDARHLLNGFEKIANRITTGVILASLIIGASLLMQVNTRFQILGYPGLAMLCFLAAAGGGVWLICSILLKDYHDKQKRR
jgi:predicted unusual protein kinase regulating ubiquinone biosynthesis (AarF/ABC1/UbiB family)